MRRDVQAIHLKPEKVKNVRQLCSLLPQDRFVLFLCLEAFLSESAKKVNFSLETIQGNAGAGLCLSRVLPFWFFGVGLKAFSHQGLLLPAMCL